MLYLLYGEDIESARKKANELVETLRVKKPDASFVALNDENWHKGQFEELLGGQGLFERKAIIFLKRAFANEEASEIILEKLPEIQKSENIFILLEGNLLKEIGDKLKKFSEKVQEFELKGLQTKTKEKFNIFALADVLGRRDKKSLWVLYQKALREGFKLEEIIGTLFWQVKSMILASRVKTAKEAGMNPYPFSKAKSFLKNWKEVELKNLSSKFVSLYHDSHRGLSDFEIALEILILRM